MDRGAAGPEPGSPSPYVNSWAPLPHGPQFLLPPDSPTRQPHTEAAATARGRPCVPSSTPGSAETPNPRHAQGGLSSLRSNETSLRRVFPQRGGCRLVLPLCLPRTLSTDTRRFDPGGRFLPGRRSRDDPRPWSAAEAGPWPSGSEKFSGTPLFFFKIDVRENEAMCHSSVTSRAPGG